MVWYPPPLPPAQRSLSTGKSSSDQETGLPSAFLAELEAVSDGSDGCNSMKLSVTHEVIEAIFRTYPSVKVRHRQLVPDKMKEEDFWIQFFQSQRFHRDLGPKNLLSSCLAEEERGQGKEESNVLNTSDSPEEGYSVFPHSPPPSSVTPHSLVQRCNLHSSMVLQAIGSSSGSSTVQSLEPETMRGESHETRLKLAPSTETVGSAGEAVDMGQLAAEVMQWTPQQTVNHGAMYSAVSHLVPGGSLMSRGGGVVSSQLSPKTRDQLYHHQLAVNELLRHFWACFPILNPQLEEKAQRMSGCLRDYSEKLGASSADSSLPDSQVTSHLLSCIQTALHKYQTWQKRRTKT
jgi:transcription initiation factor TFIIH subunit 1